MRSWNAYRANKVAQFIGASSAWFFMATTVMPADVRLTIGNWVNAHLAVSASIFVLMLLLMIVPTLNLINWRCPRCGELFSYPERSAPSCQHCGLAKFADPQVSS